MSQMKRFLEQVAQLQGTSDITDDVLEEAYLIIKNGQVNRCDECDLFLGEHTETCPNNKEKEDDKS